MEIGEWRMESGEWRVEIGEWRLENGEGRYEIAEAVWPSVFPYVDDPPMFESSTCAWPYWFQNVTPAES